MLALLLSSAHAADVQVLLGPWMKSFGVPQLQAGPGTDFIEPLAADELVAVLAISNTGGAHWSLRVAVEQNATPWPAAAQISIKRAGGSSEAGISDGLSYRLLTGQLQDFCSGTGDYESVELLVRLDGVDVRTAPGAYSLTIRYVVAMP